jgi:exopolysaccharide biosynthesis WecB/TagA/CpsF family protein
MLKRRLLVVDHTACRRPQQEPYRLLAGQGFEVLLLVPRAWHEAYGSAEAEAGEATPGFELRPCAVHFNGRYHRVLFRGLAEAVEAFQPDEIWANAEPENFLAYQALRARDRHSPKARLTLVSWRNIDYPRGTFPYKAAWLHQRIEDKLQAAGARLLCYNPQALEIMGRRGFEVLPTRMGVNLDYFSEGSKAAARKALGLPAKGRLAGFAGRFIEEKGVADLIAAAAKLKGLSLLLVGDGPAKEAWVVQAKAAGVPLALRALEHGRMAQAFQAMDVLCLPSRSTPAWKEQFGRVLVEAMACGTPVLGSDSGAIPSVIGRAGLVHPEGEIPAIASCLKQLLKKPPRQEALKRAKEFSWTAVAKKLAVDFKGRGAGTRAALPVQGVGVFPGDQAAYLTELEAAFRSKSGSLSLYLNAHLANLAADDLKFRQALRQADWVLPDGAGVLLSARLNGRHVEERLNLGDLVRPIAWTASKAGLPIFVWGGEAGVAEAASALMPGRRMGSAHGFQDEAGRSQLIKRLAAAKSGLVFLGMGSPKQEILALRLRKFCPRLHMVACGNALAYVAGLQRRAPKWMQGMHMEWAWRLAAEPRRLGKRYLVGNARFLARALGQRLGLKP